MKKHITPIILITVFVLLILIASLDKIKNETEENVFLYSNGFLTGYKNNEQINENEFKLLNEQKNIESSVNIENNKTFMQFNNEQEISDIIKNSVELVNGVSIKIDEKRIYVENEDIFNEAMEDIVKTSFNSDTDYANYLANDKKVLRTEIDGKIFTDFSINNKFEITEELVPKDYVLSSADDIKFELLNYEQEKKYDTVEFGQTVTTIIEENEITERDLLLNNDVEKDDLIYNGQKIVVNQPTPIIKVQSTFEFTKQQPLNFRTIERQDSNLRVGERKVVQTGKNGTQNVLYRQEEVNGVLNKELPVKYMVTTQSLDEIIAVGTKQVPGVGTGNFKWPSPTCNVTNGSGGFDITGSGGHIAIDISSWYGAPIYAVDNGTVSYAGWGSGGQGNYVEINHGTINGQTYRSKYFHMVNTPNVRTGQKVEKGQVLGSEGATGFVTGTHLHFELIVNGRKVNPMNYLSC